MWAIPSTPMTALSKAPSCRRGGDQLAVSEGLVPAVSERDTYLLNILDDHVLKSLQPILLVQLLEVVALLARADRSPHAVATLKELLSYMSGKEARGSSEEDLWWFQGQLCSDAAARTAREGSMTERPLVG